MNRSNELKMIVLCWPSNFVPFSTKRKLFKTQLKLTNWQLTGAGWTIFLSGLLEFFLVTVKGKGHVFVWLPVVWFSLILWHMQNRCDLEVRVTRGCVTRGLKKKLSQFQLKMFNLIRPFPTSYKFTSSLGSATYRVSIFTYCILERFQSNNRIMTAMHFSWVQVGFTAELLRARAVQCSVLARVF